MYGWFIHISWWRVRSLEPAATTTDWWLSTDSVQLMSPFRLGVKFLTIRLPSLNKQTHDRSAGGKNRGFYSITENFALSLSLSLSFILSWDHLPLSSVTWAGSHGAYAKVCWATFILLVACARDRHPASISQSY